MSWTITHHGSIAVIALDRASGGMPGAGGTQRWPRLIGVPRAAHLILTGRVVPAHEALSLGLLNGLLGGQSLPLLEGLRLEQGLFLDLIRPSRSEPLRSLANQGA